MRRQGTRRLGMLAVGLTVTAVGGGVVLAPDQARTAFSGDDGVVVFASDRATADGSTDYELYAMKADGTALRQLTDNTDNPPGDEGGHPTARAEEEGDTAIQDIQPAVAPDGGSVAFISNRAAPDGSDDNEIYVLRLDDPADVRQITDNPPGPPKTNAEYEPAWSPDGEQIVFRRGEGTAADLWIVDLTTGDERRLEVGGTGPTAWDGEPAWSPDGRHIAFKKGNGKNAAIWVYDLVANTATRIIDASETADMAPNWSPDGRRIAFSRGDHGGGAGIWIANADGTDEHQLTDPQAALARAGRGEDEPTEGEGGYSDLQPVVSPNGDRILFVSSRDGLWKPSSDSPGRAGEGSGGSGHEEFEHGNLELYVMRTDGSQQTRLTHDADAAAGPKDEMPDWQAVPRPKPAEPTAVPVPSVTGAPEVRIVAGQRASRQCLSRRTLTLRGKFELRLVRKVRRAEIVRYAVFVAGKKVKARYVGGALVTDVDLRGMPSGAYTVKAIVRLRSTVTVVRNGRKVKTRRLVEVRRFRTCVPKRG